MSFESLKKLNLCASSSASLQLGFPLPSWYLQSEEQCGTSLESRTLCLHYRGKIGGRKSRSKSVYSICPFQPAGGPLFTFFRFRTQSEKRGLYVFSMGVFSVFLVAFFHLWFRKFRTTTAHSLHTPSRTGSDYEHTCCRQAADAPLPSILCPPPQTVMYWKPFGAP